MNEPRIIGNAISIFLFVALLGGCVTVDQSFSDRRIEDKHQFEKSYQIDQQKKATVGDPLIRVRDYWVERSEAVVAIPSESVNLQGGPVNINLVQGQSYPLRGKITLDGVDYIVVQSQQPQSVLIRTDGTLHNRILARTEQGQYVQVVYTMSISNPAARLNRETVEKVKANKGYENFEILYTGKNSAGINLTYREFSPEGLARVAFFQNLTYETDAKSIAFKKFKIAIESATSSEIVFTVLEDGYK